MWGNAAVYKSLCALLLTYPTPGGAEGKQSLRDQRGVLGLGHALHSPPVHHSQQPLCWGVGWDGVGQALEGQASGACIQVTISSKSLITISESYNKGFNF